MVQITIGKIDKRTNSTKNTFTPAVSNLSIRLKNPCSMHEPVFEIKKSNFSDSSFYNYLKWGSWYYFITDIIYLTNDSWEIHTKLDILGTYKSDILAGYGFCEYGRKSLWSPYIDDPRFNADHEVPKPESYAPFSTSMGLDPTNGTVVMIAQCSLDSQVSSYSGVIAYAMSPAVYRRIMKSFSSTVMADVAQWSTTDVLDVIRNYSTKVLTGGLQALDNIISAVYIPIPLSSYSSVQLGSDHNYIGLGPYEIMLDSGDTVKVIMPDACVNSNATFNIGRLLCNTTCKFLNSPKYCSLMLTHPGGYTEINTPALIESDDLYIWWSICYATGEYTIRITTANNKDSDTINMVSGCVAVDVLMFKPGSNQTIDSHLHDMVLGLSPLGYSASPTGRSGSMGKGFTGLSLMTSGKDIQIDTNYMQPAIFAGNDATEYNNYCDKYGYPVQRYVHLDDAKTQNGETGYFVGRNVSISVNGATDEDIKYINSIINSGIYLE